MNRVGRPLSAPGREWIPSSKILASSLTIIWIVLFSLKRPAGQVAGEDPRCGEACGEHLRIGQPVHLHVAVAWVYPSPRVRRFRVEAMDGNDADVDVGVCLVLVGVDLAETDALAGRSYVVRSGPRRCGLGFRVRWLRAEAMDDFNVEVDVGVYFVLFVVDLLGADALFCRSCGV